MDGKKWKITYKNARDIAGNNIISAEKARQKSNKF